MFHIFHGCNHFRITVGRIDRFDIFYSLSTVSFSATNGSICVLDSHDSSY